MWTWHNLTCYCLSQGGPSCYHTSFLCWLIWSFFCIFWLANALDIFAEGIFPKTKDVCTFTVDVVRYFVCFLSSGDFNVLNITVCLQRMILHNFQNILTVLLDYFKWTHISPNSLIDVLRNWNHCWSISSNNVTCLNVLKLRAENRKLTRNYLNDGFLLCFFLL